MKRHEAIQEAQKLLNRRRKHQQDKIDRCAHKLIHRESTEEELRWLRRLNPYMSEGMKEIYNIYCDFQVMKQALEAANTTGEYDRYLEDVKDGYRRIKDRDKDLLGYMLVNWCTPAAESILQAICKLKELQQRLEEAGMDLCVLRPLNEKFENVLDTPLGLAMYEQRFGVPGVLYCVLEQRELANKWVIVAHLEYEYTDPDSGQIVSGRVSEDVFFNVSVNAPKILSGQPLRVRVAQQSIELKNITENLMWPLDSMLDTLWARGIVIQYRRPLF